MGVDFQRLGDRQVTLGIRHVGKNDFHVSENLIGARNPDVRQNKGGVFLDGLLKIGERFPLVLGHKLGPEILAS